MARKISAAQFRSKVRQAQQKQRQALNKFKSDVRQQEHKRRAAITRYNQAARAHNARVRANRERLRRELVRLSRQTSTIRSMVVYRTSAVSLHEKYLVLERQADSMENTPFFDRVMDLSERETANSIAVANRLTGDEQSPESDDDCDSIEGAELRDKLRRVSADLDDRWRGAVFSLNPQNPDAARHFCTSAREIFVQFLEMKAPDEEVVASDPKCDLTDQGKPTRRAKIRYLLKLQGATNSQLVDFADCNVDNVIKLFRVFNDGTHGSSGRFEWEQLRAIRKRVEDGINFLVELSGAG